MQTVFIDIGSGDGSRAQSWLAQNHKAHAFCFDPLEKNYLAAKSKEESTRVGPIGLVRLHPVQAAVTAGPATMITPGATATTAKFYCANDVSSCSLLPFNASGITRWLYPPGKIHFKTTDVIDVPVVRMDNFLNERRIEHVAFVRIETQGTALDVLKSFGKRLQFVMEFCIKVHTDNAAAIYEGQTRKDDLVAFMAKNGFSVYDKITWSREQEEFIWFVNRLVTKHQFHFDL